MRRIKKLFENLKVGDEFYFTDLEDSRLMKKITVSHYSICPQSENKYPLYPLINSTEVWVDAPLRLHWSKQQEITKGLGVLYPISYVQYEQGHLARIEYCLEKDNWMISLFNGLFKERREGTIHEIERIKEVAELLVRDNANVILARYFFD